MTEYTSLGNIVEGPHLIGLGPSHEGEVNKKQMLGTTKLETVLVHSTRSVTTTLLAYRGPCLDGVVARVGNRDGAVESFGEAQP